MLFAFGLGVGGGLANELESRVLGEVTDFVRPGVLEDSVFAPADLAMYAATAPHARRDRRLAGAHRRGALRAPDSGIP